MPRSNSYEAGRISLAVPIILLFICALFAIYYSYLWCDPNRDKVSRVQADLRTLATCLEQYYIDHENYPAAASGKLGANNLYGAGPDERQISTFRIRLNANDPLHTLTTPVSYCVTYFSDPWAKTKRLTYGYFPKSALNKYGIKVDGWILWSGGRDEDYDIIPEEDYDPLNHPTPSLVNKTYDPSNGSRSNGDIWRVKQ